jgi:hypothetical protein
MELCANVVVQIRSAAQLHRTFRTLKTAVRKHHPDTDSANVIHKCFQIALDTFESPFIERVVGNGSENVENVPTIVATPGTSSHESDNWKARRKLRMRVKRRMGDTSDAHECVGVEQRNLVKTKEGTLQALLR